METGQWTVQQGAKSAECTTETLRKTENPLLEQCQLESARIHWIWQQGLSVSYFNGKAADKVETQGAGRVTTEVK